ncbi:BA14K family protein [Daeguia caeni]|uniref:Lectin-like protein BA14k n=1 Tax=Daeguia caeni TaxID=439612 RepID=A0ABV9H378_9HYPH
MNRISKTIVLALAAIATVAVPMSTASADPWGRPGGWRPGWDYPGPRPMPPRRHRGNGDAVAAGVIGLAAGALIGSALAQPPRRVYVEPQYAPPPPPPAYYPSAPRPAAYKPGFQPWTPGWYNYCANRYRSFNPNTGTYRGYDGRDHFCNAN